MTIEIKEITYTNVDTVVFVPVVFDAGAPITSLTGAILDVRALASNGTKIVGSATLNGAGDRITVTFLAGLLPAGKCNVQVWAQSGVQRIMIHDFDLRVRSGHKPVS